MPTNCNDALLEEQQWREALLLPDDAFANLMQLTSGRGDIVHILGIGERWRSLWAYEQGTLHHSLRVCRASSVNA
jgi:hypothetical protein